MTKLEFNGSLEEVKSEIEQAIATYKLLGNRSSVDFEAWFEKWEKGFPEAIENRAAGNYQLAGEKPWRQAGKLPRWWQWSKEGGIITGEYWRDRGAEADSIPLSGTPEQLINHIIQIEYEGGGEKTNQDKNSNWPPIKGQPQIKLYFRGEGRAEGETSIRIMTKTDDPKVPLPLIDKSDLRQFANKIKQAFATPNLYTWQKGREIISYKSKWQGFEGQWWLCRNQAAGRELVSKLLQITDQQPDPSKFRLNTAPEEALAFPTNPPNIVVLGESLPQNEERPLVNVQFWRAEIKLAKMRKPIPLVERGVIVYE